MRYLPPGQPAPPLPAPTANTYIIPSAQTQQPPTRASPALPPHDQDPHHALITAWRAHHGPEWIRADDLPSAVRMLIDPKDRTAAIRQRLRHLLTLCPELEAKSVGNRARTVVHYRVVESEAAGLEG